MIDAERNLLEIDKFLVAVVNAMLTTEVSGCCIVVYESCIRRYQQLARIDQTQGAKRSLSTSVNVQTEWHCCLCCCNRWM